jgi:two-component system, LytTR family, response regulator
MPQIRVLIVDDEYLARDRMKELLAQQPDLVLAGEAATGPDAVRAIESLQPDVVLLDISLPAMDGFEVLACVETEPLPLVIFTTAYDGHAIRAFEIDAVDYLLKPVEEARFAEAFRRARGELGDRMRGESDQRVRRFIDSATSSSSRMVVRQGDRIVFVRAPEIDVVEAVGNYVRILRGTERFVVRQTLSSVEQRLMPHGFVRIQRSVLVNVERIAELRREAKESYVVVLTTGARFRLSPHYRANLEGLLGKF